MPAGLLERKVATSFSYLARNREFTGELQKVKLNLEGPELGKSEGSLFLSVGGYASDVLRRDVYLGMKRPMDGNGSRLSLSGRLPFELAFTETAIGAFPDLAGEFASFCVAVMTSTGKVVGLLTEDVSHAGKRGIIEKGDTPDKLRDLFIPGVIVDDSFRKMAMTVTGENGQEYRRLLDLFPLVEHRYRAEQGRNFGEPEVKSDLDRHTVIWQAA
jgi:hypothetical protein